MQKSLMTLNSMLPFVCRTEKYDIIYNKRKMWIFFYSSTSTSSFCSSSYYCCYTLFELPLKFFHFLRYQNKEEKQNKTNRNSNVPKEHYFMKISKCAMCLRKNLFLFYYFSTQLFFLLKTREKKLQTESHFHFFLDRWLLACEVISTFLNNSMKINMFTYKYIGSWSTMRSEII